MEIFFFFIGTCLLIAAIVFLLKYHLLKKQLNAFTSEIRLRENDDYNQPLKVESFNKDIVALANALNEHVDLQRSLSENYIAYKKELSDIISGISHDFRTPLTAALGYLQLIEKSGELTEQNREYLDIITEKNKYLKQLSDDFFELTTLKNHMEEPETERIPFSNFLSELLLEQYGWISSKQLKTSFNIEENLLLDSDRHLLERILTNLFSNAEKYAVSFFGVTLEQKNKTLILQVFNDVSDKTEIDTEKVFEPFYRSASRSKSGNGLGLYVVKCLSEQLGYETQAYFNGCFFTIEIKMNRFSKNFFDISRY